MERKYTKLDDFKDAMMDVLAEYEKYVKDNIDMSDFEVRNQKSLFYKWRCKKWYAHCFKNNADSGICLRCGAKVYQVNKII